MIAFLKGTMAGRSADTAFVDVNGVGFAVYMPATDIVKLPEAGADVALFTHLAVREDAMTLYGFLSQEEHALFLRLIGVSGIGPKAALAILSVVSPEQLTLAVMTQDDKTITMAQGVGKKLAQRIILELKDKLGASQLELNTAEFAGSGAPVRGSRAAEATAALVGLGYSQTEAAAALKGIDIENLSIEDVIRRALRAAAQQ